GVLANAIDIANGQRDWVWAWPLVALGWGGVALVAFERGRGGGAADQTSRPPRWLRLLPLSTGLGAVTGFALVVGRAEPRFVLPLGLALSIYGGLAAARASAWLAR